MKLNTKQQQKEGRNGQTQVKKRILVFSPDADVASSLTLLLADRFDVTCESNLGQFNEKLHNWQPVLILADLHPLPQDIMKLVEILKQRPSGTYAILLHVYRNWTPAIETAIRTVADFVFYKPVNVEMIATVIADLLDGRQSPINSASNV